MSQSTSRRSRRSRLTGIGVAALTALALAAVPATQAEATAAAHQHVAQRPTIVLVHGAFADASGWSAEVIKLQALGYDVIAPPNPLRGLTYDSNYIRSVVETIPGPVILAGHSYGGAVVSNAARGATNVEALVFVGAFVPDAGESIATSYDPVAYPGSLLGPDTTTVLPTYNPATPDGQDVDVYIKPSSFRDVFAGDQSRAIAQAMAATQRPLSNFAQTEPSGEPAWKTLPSWDLITLEDHAISPGGQVFMANRAGSHITKVHSAHDVMISHPDDVVKLILKAVKAVN